MTCPKCSSTNIKTNLLTESLICGSCGLRWEKATGDSSKGEVRIGGRNYGRTTTHALDLLQVLLVPDAEWRIKVDPEGSALAVYAYHSREAEVERLREILVSLVAYAQEWYSVQGVMEVRPFVMEQAFLSELQQQLDSMRWD